MTIQFEVAITKDEMFRGEKTAQEWGLTRRLALGVMTRSSSDFKEMGAQAAEGMMDAFDNVSKYLKWRERETKLLESAQARMLAILETYSDAHPNHEAELKAQAKETL